MENPAHVPVPADVSVSGGGTVYLFHLHTPAARAWVESNVHLEPYQWMGGSAFAVEHRFAGGLAAGMQNDGLTVE